MFILKPSSHIIVIIEYSTQLFYMKSNMYHIHVLPVTVISFFLTIWSTVLSARAYISNDSLNSIIQNITQCKNKFITSKYIKPSMDCCIAANDSAGFGNISDTDR